MPEYLFSHNYLPDDNEVRFTVGSDEEAVTRAEEIMEKAKRNVPQEKRWDMRAVLVRHVRTW